MMTRGPGDPDWKDDPNDPLTRRPSDPVPSLVDTYTHRVKIKKTFRPSADILCGRPLERWPFVLIICARITPRLRNVYTNFGFWRLFVFELVACTGRSEKTDRLSLRRTGNTRSAACRTTTLPRQLYCAGKMNINLLIFMPSNARGTYEILILTCAQFSFSYTRLFLLFVSR